MNKTQFQGVFERPAGDGRSSLVIRYKIRGTAHTESLGIKGAKLNGGEILSAKVASLIRSDRITQVAREGEVVLQRGKACPTLDEVWADLQDQMHGTAGLRIYRRKYDKYLRPLGSLTLEQLTEQRLEQAVREWKSLPEYRTHYGRPPAPATIRIALAVVQRLFNLAVNRERYFGKVPVSGKRHSGGVRIQSDRSLNNTRERVFSIEEVDRILDWAWQNDRNLWLQAKLSLATGMRQRELCGCDEDTDSHHGLRWMDVNFERSELTILRKGGIHQTIQVDSEVLETLRTVTHRDPFSRVAGPYARRSWERCRRELDLNPTGTLPTRIATWHSWRHTFATWYLEDGGNIKDLSELMHHSSIQVTARYLTSNADNKRRTLEAMGKRLRRAKFKVV